MAVRGGWSNPAEQCRHRVWRRAQPSGGGGVGVRHPQRRLGQRYASGRGLRCPKPIRLHHGRAFVTPIPRRWSRDSFYGKRGVTVDSGRNAVVFGDFAGSGEDDAGLNVDCNNGGGTADGALLYSWVIFSGSGGRLSAVGVVTPQVQPATCCRRCPRSRSRPGRSPCTNTSTGPTTRPAARPVAPPRSGPMRTERCGPAFP